MNAWEKGRAALVLANQNPNPESVMRLFGDYINEWIEDKAAPVSVEDLDRMAAENRPVLLEKLSEANPQMLAMIRGTVRKVVPLLDPNTHYAMIIHRVSDKHMEHAKRLLLHLQWFVDQITGTLGFLMQDGSADAPPQ